MATAVHNAPRQTRGAESRPQLAVPAGADERPLWQVVAVLYAAIACLAVLLIGVCFLAAYLATGSAY